MPLQVAPVTDPSDLDQICPLDHDAWLTPYNPQLKHFRPPFPTRAESIAYAKSRYTKELSNNDQNTFMIKVTDSDLNEIIGWAIWALNDPENVKGDGSTHATWYPEGSEEREFAETFINGLWGFLAERVKGRHMDLLSITVHPGHRHRGAGRLLLQWGKAKADELGVETVISSLLSARGAYEKSGFGRIELIPPSPRLHKRMIELEKEGKGEKWAELMQDDLSGWLMWRPVGRDWKEGDRAPWM